MPDSRTVVWPSLPLKDWQDTLATLHMWTQIVGHVSLAQTPLVNHWWNTTLYLTSRGLTTSPIPYDLRTFQIDFDFIDHRLVVNTSDGLTKSLEMEPRSVAAFYAEFMGMLDSLGMPVHIHGKPDEVPDPIPFVEDSRFIGKCSPVHFFWGSFDLAVTRFSGRRAPERLGADAITREAYSHEVISHGFWPGGGAVESPMFYSYTAPAPPGLESAPVRPGSAFYSTEMSEFFLPYDEIRKADSPDAMLLEFLQSTYEAGATLANWNRAELERAE
jgi:Family of unknown function (DUF5996)